MGEGSTEFLMSLFHGADDGFEQADDGFDMPTTGSGAASSSSWVPPAPAGRGLGGRGRRPPRDLLGRGPGFSAPHFDDGLDGDMSDDDLFLDEDSLDGPFSDEYLDDGLGLPSFQPQQPWRIVHRSNPFGRLQLKPVRRLRPGFSAQDLPASFGAATVSPASLAVQKQGEDSSTGQSLQNGQTSAGSGAAPSRSGKSVSPLMQPVLAEPAATPALVSLESALVPVSFPETPSQIADVEALVPCVDGDLAVQGASPRGRKGKRQGDDEVAVSRGQNKKSAELKAQVNLMAKDSTSPAPPKFAFEWFRTSRVEDSEELPVLIQQWKALADTERAQYAQMAEKDRERFETEYADWSRQRVEEGKHDPSVEDLMGHQQKVLDQDLALTGRSKGKRTCDGGLEDAKRKRMEERQQKAKRGSMPAGYPAKPVKAYGFFCKEHKLKLASERAAAVTSAGEGGGEKAQDAVPRRSALAEYKAAWDALTEEDRDSFKVKAAADEQRFRADLEAWLAEKPDGGLGEAAEKEGYLRMAAKKTLSRPAVPKGPRKARLEPQERTSDPNSMDSVLRGAISLRGPPQPKPAKAPAPGEGDQKSVTNGDGKPANPANELDDFWASFGVTATASSSSSSDAKNAHAEPGPSAGPAGNGAMPTPQGVPAAFGPGGREESADLVDDLLAGFGPDAVETEQEQTNEPAYEEESALANWQDPSLAWSETPETSGPPQAFGPQVCIDESGNIVVKQSSLSKTMESTMLPEEMVGPAVESVSRYQQAYKKTPITRWSDEETAQFYEALEIYGMDLFLVQTFFRHKSASQIKTKYTKEMKKNRGKVEQALTSKARKLTKDAFEKQHGKIDTTKHYQPAKTPEPGEEPEPDGSLPADDPDAVPDPAIPPEPEYTEEDESLTTNRLMALFD